MASYYFIFRNYTSKFILNKFKNVVTENDYFDIVIQFPILVSIYNALVIAHIFSVILKRKNKYHR